jgi:hypothetical protein
MPEKPASTLSLRVRIPPELVYRIDAVRGLVAREAYIRALLTEALDAREGKKKR